jgi:hypothetical protein
MERITKYEGKAENPLTLAAILPRDAEDLRTNYCCPSSALSPSVFLPTPEVPA